MALTDHTLILRRARRANCGVSVSQDFTVERCHGAWSARNVPIIINNFQRVEYLRELVSRLRRAGYDNLYIIDNSSTYEPLLDYYREQGLRVFWLDRNVGYLALWATSVIDRFADGYYVYTDSDIVPADECPDDFIDEFKRGLDSHAEVGKVGFGLKVDDLPDAYALKPRVLAHESQFSRARAGAGFYRAAIDTTFALYRPGVVGGSWIPSLRTATPYVARHLPWYENSAAPSAEEVVYRQSIATSTHWTFRAEGPGSVRVPLEGAVVSAMMGSDDDLWNMVSRGEYRPETLEAIDDLLVPGATFVDASGDPGALALYAARTAGRVCALRRDHDLLASVRENVALNADVTSNIDALSLTGAARGDGDCVPSIEGLLERHHGDGPLMLCIDVHGNGVRLSPGLVRCLRRHRPTLVVTLNPGMPWGLTTGTTLGRALIGLLGLVAVPCLLWKLRFYRRIYASPGRSVRFRDIVRLLSSRITFVATDETWSSRGSEDECPA